MTKAPFYSTPSASVGGGAVGVVPFRIYETDCEPPLTVRSFTPPSLPSSGAAVASAAFNGASGSACNAPVPVKIRFYGPVALTSSNSLLIKGASQTGDAVCGQQFTDMVQSMFLIRAPGSHPEVNARTIGLSRAANCPTMNVGKFRIGETESFPDDFVVRSVPGTGVTTIPAGFFDVCNGDPEHRAYYFRIVATADNCVDPGNFNGVDGLTVLDIFDFLNAWFASNPAADVDGIGGIAVADIFFFLNEWFDGCA